MILRYKLLSQHPRVFHSMTGLRLPEFEELFQEVLPLHAAATARSGSPAAFASTTPAAPATATAVGCGRRPGFYSRSARPDAVGDCLAASLSHARGTGLLVWSKDSSVSRLIERVLPVLQQSGRDTMRMPDPGKKHRRTLDTLLQKTPQLAVLIDSFEQRVQRPRAGSGSQKSEPKKKDTFYSGKKKQHTLKSQVAVDEASGQLWMFRRTCPARLPT